MQFTEFIYHIAGKFGGKKFGKFGKSSVIRQTNLVFTIDNLLADLSIRQTSPLYGSLHINQDKWNNVKSVFCAHKLYFLMPGHKLQLKAYISNLICRFERL